MKAVFKIEDRPPFFHSIVLAVQHILAAFNGIVAVPLVVGGAIALSRGDLGYYISAAIFCAGIVTIIQTRSFFGVGSRLPCVMGTSFTFVGPSISVAKELGLAGMFGATVAGSFLETFAAFFVPWIKKLFPKVVTASVITLIGLSLVPVAVDWSFGGVGAPDYGSPSNFAIAILVLSVVLALNCSKNQFLNTSAVFLGMLTGFIFCVILGRVDFKPVADAGWFNLPMPLHFGIKFSWSALIPFLVAYLVTTVETIGDLTATARACNREITEKELKGGILADGIGSAIGGVMSGGANTTFTQNIGIISITGVASRYVVELAGFILLLLGICPKLGALMAVMPVPVLGGAGIVMFGMVAAAGMSGLKDIDLDTRNMMIFSISIVMGLAVVFRPDILRSFPPVAGMFFSSGITTGTLFAVILNFLLPRRDLPAKDSGNDRAEDSPSDTTEDAKSL